MSRTEVADFLRQFADELDDADSPFTEDPDAADRTSRRSRERADDLRDHEDDEGLDDPRRVTLVVGGDSATVTLPETVEFDIEVASRSGMFASGVTQSIDFELSWEIEETDERDDSIEVV